MYWKNVFTQKKFGECGYVCLANFLNNGKIISEAENTKEGLNWFTTRKVIEKYSGYSLQQVLYLQNPCSYYIPVFELDHDFSGTKEEHKDHYLVFIAGVYKRKGVNHCLLVVKQNHNKSLIVLDPFCDKANTMTQKKFQEKYQLVELDLVVDKSDGWAQFFYEEALNHLIER